jgi:hypothetical protein
LDGGAAGWEEGEVGAVGIGRWWEQTRWFKGRTDVVGVGVACGREGDVSSLLGLAEEWGGDELVG